MIIRLLSLVSVSLISIAALFFLLPSMKEGYDLDELPRFAACAVGLAILAWLWRRSLGGAWRAAGLAAIAIPFLAYAALSAKLVFNFWYGRRLASLTHITSFQVTPLVWPGFTDPVGIRLELELDHSPGLDVALLPPKIAMTGMPELTAKQYFSYLSEFQRGFLTVPLFPVGRESPRDVFRDSHSRLVYDLYPSTIHSRENPRHVCFWKDGPQAPIYADGPHLSAAWYFITRGGASVDLSPQLSERIRASGLLSGQTQDQWTQFLRRVEPPGLVQAGYMPCPDSQGAGERCFCR